MFTSSFFIIIYLQIFKINESLCSFSSYSNCIQYDTTSFLLQPNRFLKFKNCLLGNFINDRSPLPTQLIQSFIFSSICAESLHLCLVFLLPLFRNQSKQFNLFFQFYLINNTFQIIQYYIMQVSESIFYRPTTSYFYIPKKTEEFYKDKRYIFYGQIQHTLKQKKAIEQYKAYLKSKKDQHSAYIDDNRIGLFLQEKNFKMDDTYKAIKFHDQWRKTNLPIKLTEQVKSMLESGIIYLCGRDHRYRPIVIMNLKLFDEKKTQLIIRAFTYFFQEIIQKVLLPGQVQQWVTIMNVEGFSLFSLPLGGGKKLLNHLETHYRGRLYKLYLVNSPSAVWISWKIVKQFLQDSTVEKVDIISNNQIKQLYKHTNLSQIQVKFGGSQSNRTVFWPGAKVPQTFLLKQEKYENLHITPQQYEKRLESLKYNIISPKFLYQEKEQKQVKQLKSSLQISSEFIKLEKKEVEEQPVIADKKMSPEKFIQFNQPIKELVQQEKESNNSKMEDAKREQSKHLIQHIEDMNTEEIIAQNLQKIKNHCITAKLQQTSFNAT